MNGRTLLWSMAYQILCKRLDILSLIFTSSDYSEKFEKYSDASNSQIGSVITQKNRPLSFISRKFSDTQTLSWYSLFSCLCVWHCTHEYVSSLWPLAWCIRQIHVLGISRTQIETSRIQILYCPPSLDDRHPQLCAKENQLAALFKTTTNTNHATH